MACWTQSHKACRNVSGVYSVRDVLLNYNSSLLTNITELANDNEIVDTTFVEVDPDGVKQKL